MRLIDTLWLGCYQEQWENIKRALDRNALKTASRLLLVREEFFIGIGDFASDASGFGFAPDAGDGDGPEGDEIDAGDEFDEKRRQKLPVPSQQAHHHGGDAEVEQIVSGRESACYKRGENNELKGIRDNGQQHGQAKLRTGGDNDGIIRHRETRFIIVDVRRA